MECLRKVGFYSPTIDRHIDRVSIDRSIECQPHSIDMSVECRSLVSIDTRPRVPLVHIIRFMKTSNLRKYYNILIIITQLTSLSSRHSWLRWKWFTCKHGEPSSPRAEFFTSTSLSKGFDNSLSVLQFLVDISEKTKANDLVLECLSNILNPYVIFRFF